jgi:nucleotide-binding universal stress UspA family protein
MRRSPLPLVVGSLGGCEAGSRSMSANWRRWPTSAVQSFAAAAKSIQPQGDRARVGDRDPSRRRGDPASDPRNPTTVSAGIAAEPETEDLQTPDEAERWTEELARGLREQGLQVNSVVLDSQHRQVADAIVAYAREHAPDLLVIGSHGRSELPSLVLGSVADKVVRRAPCPVLVAEADRVADLLRNHDLSLSADPLSRTRSV